MPILPDTIEPLEQADAQAWLEKISDDPVLRDSLKRAFQEETRDSGIRALPPEERLYFLILTTGSPELIAGLHPPTNGLSSILKLLPKQEAKSCGRDCVRKLIEEVIVPRCRSKGQPCFSTNTFWSDDGSRVFSWLATNLPKGVVKITMSMPGVFALWLVPPESV